MRLLDLFCGAGGAAVGYHRAGFEVIGVDIKPQPRYPFEFHKADALEFILTHGWEFDAIHASPPCQAYSRLKGLTTKAHPELIEATRNALRSLYRKPYVIENVIGAPLQPAITLCGCSFNLQVYRERVFESNFALFSPGHRKHVAKCAKQGRPVQPGEFITVAGCFSGVKFARKAMGIDWMMRDELRQAIPPAYTEFIGRQLIQILQQ